MTVSLRRLLAADCRLASDALVVPLARRQRRVDVLRGPLIGAAAAEDLAVGRGASPVDVEGFRVCEIADEAGCVGADVLRDRGLRPGVVGARPRAVAGARVELELCVEAPRLLGVRVRVLRRLVRGMREGRALVA